jgi:hypothetical protein
MDSIEIGASPSNEECAQCGIDPDFGERNRAECRALMHQLRRVHGDEPEGARLYIKANPHDFGTYREVACKFDSDDETATAYALLCEEDTPQQWDDEARAELAAAGFAVQVQE